MMKVLPLKIKLRRWLRKFFKETIDAMKTKQWLTSFFHSLTLQPYSKPSRSHPHSRHPIIHHTFPHAFSYSLVLISTLNLLDILARKSSRSAGFVSSFLDDFQLRHVWWTPSWCGSNASQRRPWIVRFTKRIRGVHRLAVTISDVYMPIAIVSTLIVFDAAVSSRKLFAEREWDPEPSRVLPGSIPQFASVFW